MKKFLVFEYNNIKFALLNDIIESEVDKDFFNESEKRFKVENVFYERSKHFLTNIKKYFKTKINDYVIEISAENLFYKEIEDNYIDLSVNRKYIDGKFDIDNEIFLILDLGTIIKDNETNSLNRIKIDYIGDLIKKEIYKKEEIEKDIKSIDQKERKFKKQEFEENIILNEVKKMNEENKIEKLENAQSKKDDNGNSLNESEKEENKEESKEESDEYLGTEEDKKRIFEEIQRISDSLKIRDVQNKIFSYLKNSLSFTKIIVFLYILLISVSTIAFAGFLIYSKREELKKNEKIAKIESIEAILIKELKRKQEEEKKKLESMLNQIQDELSKVTKEKEEFLKNQDKILEERQKKLYEEYLAKLEEQKKLLKNNTISKEEYDRIVSEINLNYNKQLSELKNEVEKAKQEYLSKVAEVEKKLQQDKESYQNQIKEKEKSIEETKSQISSLEKQLEEEKKKSQELEQKLSQVQSLSSEEFRIQKKISNYLLNVSNEIKNKNYKKALLILDEFKDYLTNSTDSKKISNENKIYYVSLADTFSSFIEKIQNEENEYNEKVKLLTLANDYYKSKKYEESFNTYKKAFLNYFVVTDIDKQSLENFVKVSYILIDQKEKKALEDEADILYKKIIQMREENNFKDGLDLCKLFIKNYSFSSKLQEVVDIANYFQKLSELNRMDTEVVRIFREMNSFYETGDYIKAKSRGYDILLRFPGNSYTRQVIDLLKKIDDKITESLKNVSQTIVTAQSLIEKTQFEILGRVIFYSEDTEVVRFRIEKTGVIKVGDELKVYKLDKDNNYVMVAIIKVTEITEDVAKATVISKKENIVFGSIISK